MSITRAEILLHPVRMRLLQVVSASGPCTARQVADVLDDIPATSLYRHLGRLVEAGLLDVVAERPVRGAVEKTYDLPRDTALLSPESADAPAEVHFRAFLSFVAGQLSTFSQYLEGEAPDLRADGVAYQSTPLYLSDDEHTALLQQLREVIGQAMANPPTAERTLRLLSVAMLPAGDDLSREDTDEL
ncbi:MAG: DNA-binding transcriptional ArsR family regulator [Myxococcota bacterium]|jgi:DNA-binding transcriptional ArsR family regulator